MNANEKHAKSQELDSRLDGYARAVAPLLGIRYADNRIAYIFQLIDSLQRIEYVRVMAGRCHRLSPDRMNPQSMHFDPVQAAVLSRENDFEEACWLVFLAIHCGKHLHEKWLLSRELYGCLGPQKWTWVAVSADPVAYRSWLRTNRNLLSGKFGNHRKYESLNDGNNGTGQVITSYVEWVKSFGSHAAMFAWASAESNGDSRIAFHLLYDGMRQVRRFGRIGRFDYLTMIAKIGLAEIEADSAYLVQATRGPLSGARLLFDGHVNSTSSAKSLDTRLIELDGYLGVGMQALEDSLCNWQKSPNRYHPFRG